MEPEPTPTEAEVAADVAGVWADVEALAGVPGGKAMMASVVDRYPVDYE